MKEIRVLHVDAERGWRGGQQQACYIHEGLVNAGVHSDFACRTGSKLEQRLKKANLPYKTFPYFGEADLFSAISLAAYSRKHKISILHLHSSHALSWGLTAKFFMPKLKLIAARRVDFHIGKNILSRRKYFHPKLDAIVAISDNIRQVLISDGIAADRIHLIHSGVDIHRFEDAFVPDDFRARWGIPEKALIVGTIAALVGHKDYPNFIQAAALAIAQNPLLYFIAVGSGEKMHQIKALARDLGIMGNITFTGAQKEVGSLMKAFDIFVLASKKEGLGTSVLDAMSVGKPVIGSRAGGIPEMIIDSENGLLVDKQNPQQLAEAILRLAQDQKLRDQLGSAARERVKLFSREEMIRKNLELYQRLL